LFFAYDLRSVKNYAKICYTVWDWILSAGEHMGTIIMYTI